MSAASQSATNGGLRVTPTMEDYLKAVYQLRDETGTVTTQQLADQLGVSGPSVTNMIKRLAELGLLRHTRYHGGELTAAGERIALEVIRHHRLLERYLVEALGFSWDEVHAEAERLEHHISEALEARLDAALGHPTVDPHGDPIPHLDGTIAAVDTLPLTHLLPGQAAEVHRVSSRDPERLRYLEQLRLKPGTRIMMLEALPFDGPLRLEVAGTEHVIGRPLAASVRVVNCALSSGPR